VPEIPRRRPGYLTTKQLPEYRKANVPEFCPILGHEELIPVVDHDHQSGRVRGVVSSEGNALLGKVENFYRSRCVHAAWYLPDVLCAMAQYLDQPQGPFHPIGARQVTKRFGRKSKVDQSVILRELGAETATIDACGNSRERTKLFRKLLLED